MPINDRKIPDRKITDLDSFETVTGQDPVFGERQIAALYFYQVLDCLVALAYRVSSDFRKRPQLYRDLGTPSIAETLAELNAKYGTEITFLSTAERNEIYLPIFGNTGGSSSNESSDFARLRTDLVRAATIFAEGALEHGLPMLREGVLTAHRPFKDYLLSLQGESVRFSKEKALFQMTEKICYPILRSQHIAAIFGVTATISGDDYPYDTDPAEDLLMAQIAGQLTWRTDSVHLTLTQERISNLQNAALKGAEAIANAIDFDDKSHTDGDIDLLVTKCYNWGTALIGLSGPSMTPLSHTQRISSTTTTSTTAPPAFAQRRTQGA